MSLFSSTRAKLAASKIAEEQLYAQAAEEVAAGVIRQGLWAKAIAESDGNEAAAKARYIKLRVELMIAEADLAEHAVGVAVHEVKRAAKESARESARESQQAWAAAEAERFEREAADREEEAKETDAVAYWLFTAVILLVIISGLLALWGDLY